MLQFTFMREWNGSGQFFLLFVLVLFALNIVLGMANKKEAIYVTKVINIRIYTALEEIYFPIKFKRERF